MIADQPIINLNNADFKFKNEVVAEEGGKYLKKCFQCSSCTLTCPVADSGLELNPRKVIRQVLFGLRKEVLESKAIWQCVGCFECTDRCPQNVRFTEVIEALRRIAVRSSKSKDKKKKIRLPKEGKLKHSFDKRFKESVWLWGRSWEPEMIGRYFLYGRGIPFGALIGFRYISLILGMFLKFKIEFFPPWNSKARKEVRAIFKNAKRKEN
ncbi:MAG: 4Fe-4S dicluster domain-containing protein [Candidatus Hodarchaeales archaeon]|jgi:heterodisulfide reductase subunit C